MPILQCYEPFTINPGDVILIPHGAVLCRSKNRQRFPETSKVAYLINVGDEKEGEEKFTFSRNSNPKGKLFILFLPRFASPGTLLHISWREGNCACAEHMDTQSGMVVTFSSR